MRNKIIFWILGIALFAFSSAAGFYAPSWVKSYQQTTFVPGSVPKRQVEAFAAHFADLETINAPEFLPDISLLKPDGKTTRFSKLAHGRPMLVNLWATWCAPCVAELPTLLAFQKHYAGKIDVAAIAVEDGKKPEDLNLFLEKRLLTELSAFLDDKAMLMNANGGLRGIPTTFFLSKDGQILYRFEGDADWMSPDSLAFFDLFLLQDR
jgi:thiol-disulfide isomerase/thioredoxin